MPTQCRPEQLVFAPVEGRSVVVSFTGGVITSDAGALLLGATDRAIDLVKRFAACFQDARDPDLIEHTLATLIGQRVFGIALGYEDLIDHDQLRHDPVLAVLGARSREGLTVRDASELRIKETDRIATVADNFRRMGVSMEVAPDGFHIPGGQKFSAAELDSHGDHRIAMAFAVAALAAEGECAIRNAEAASVSYPEFFDTLESLRTT